MKKIPAKYELSEDDLKAAIAYWFVNVQGVKLLKGFEIQYKQEQVPYMDNQTKDQYTAIVTQGAE